MVIVVQNKDSGIFPTRHVNAPPPYSFFPTTPIASSSPLPDPPFPASASVKRASSFQALPQHILLQIVYATIPPLTPRSRTIYVETLYWLIHSMRLVSRDTYIACMNFLRSTFLSDYTVNVKSPYTCDPFPLEPPESSLPPQYQQPQAVQSMQRETAVLDRFITLKCCEDMRSNESELHLDLDSFKDIFELGQPKARTEDLVRHYGLRAGVLSIVAPPLASSTPTSRLPTPLPFSAISVNFSSRKVGIIVLRRTAAEVRREKEETLESVAKRLINELARFLGRAGG